MCKKSPTSKDSHESDFLFDVLKVYDEYVMPKFIQSSCKINSEGYDEFENYCNIAAIKINDLKNIDLNKIEFGYFANICKDYNFTKDNYLGLYREMIENGLKYYVIEFKSIHEIKHLDDYSFTKLIRSSCITINKDKNNVVYYRTDLQYDTYNIFGFLYTYLRWLTKQEYLFGSNYLQKHNLIKTHKYKQYNLIEILPNKEFYNYLQIQEIKSV